MSSDSPNGPPAEATPVDAELLAEIERIGDALAGRRDHADLARRLEWLVDLLIQRGNLLPGHRRLVGKLRAAQSSVKLALFRDKRAITGVDIDCESRIALCRAACCRFTVSLSAQDVAERVLRFDIHEPYLMPKDADTGHCIYCGDGGRCAVYADRPGACRAYDCRNDSRVWLDFERRIPAFTGDEAPPPPASRPGAQR